MIVMAVIAISFASCADDDEDKDSGGGTSVVQDGKISGKIENFNNEINGFRCYLSSTSKFILDVPVTNGSFSFTLPNPSYSDLRSFNYFEYGAGERLKISNDTARFVSIYFVGYPSSYRSYYLKL